MLVSDLYIAYRPDSEAIESAKEYASSVTDLTVCVVIIFTKSLILPIAAGFSP